MKYYTDKGRDGQDKLEKTCRKTQHVKIDMERDVSIIICRMAAVGENYNSTRDSEEKWEAQHTPRVCYFLKEAYTSNENGYNLVEDLHDCERPWTMWRKVAIWTQARKIIHDSTRERQRVFTERYAWKAAV